MKFSIQKNSLLNGINIAIRGVSSRTTLPILQGILIKTEKDSINLLSTDLEIGIECKISAKIIEKGEIVLSAKMLSDLVRKLPDEEVFIETDENNIVNIECGSIYFTISGSDYNEFPDLPEIKEEYYFKINQNILKELIRKTVFCIAQDSTRPILTGVLFEVYNKKIKAVALDGFRMAIYEQKIEKELIYATADEEKYSIVIPGKTLDEISKIMTEEDEDIEIYYTENQVLFKMKNTKVISRLLEGNYMNYNSVLPKEHKSLVRMKRQDLIEGIERASLIAESKNNLIKFSIGDNNIIISSNSDKGKMKEKIKVFFEGMFLEIAFNSRYLLESLKAMDEDEIELYFINNINPLIIKPVNNKSYLYMILPVKLN